MRSKEWWLVQENHATVKLVSSVHRTKYQESVNGNVVEICETVAETRRLTRVSASGLVTFTRVSVAADTTEPDDFFTCFRQVSVEGNVWFRKRNFVLKCAETRGNVTEIWIFAISVDGIRPKRSRKYSGITFLPGFRWRFVPETSFFPCSSLFIGLFQHSSFLIFLCHYRTGKCVVACYFLIHTIYMPHYVKSHK